jgi:O-antigen/teichoic acid export membrane protein
VPIADQLAWSATNVLMVIAAAQLLSAAAFGTFSAALLIVVIALTTARSFVTEPLLLRLRRDARADERSSRDGAVIGGSLVLVPALAIGAVALLAIFDAGAALPVLLVLAAATAATVAQDAVRFVALATSRPRLALASDLVWLVCAAAYLWYVLGGGDGGVVQCLVVWTVGAALAFVVGLVLLQAIPRFGSGVEWVRSSRSFGSRLAADALAGVAAANVAFLALGAIAGPEALGGLRGAYLLLGPMNAATEGVYLAVVPALAVRTAEGHRIGRSIVRTGIALTAAWAVYSAVVLAVPDSWLEALLGATWDYAGPVLPWLLLASVFGAVGIAAVYGVRAWRSAATLVRIRVAMLPLYLVGLPLASWWDGATGFAIGLVAVSVVQITLYGWSFRRLEAAGPAVHPDPARHQGQPEHGVPVEDLVGDQECDQRADDAGVGGPTDQ